MTLYGSEQVLLEKVMTNKKVLIYRVTLRDGENRFTLAMNEQLLKTLDLIESSFIGHPSIQKAALLITGTDKYFSLGLDLCSYYNSPSPQDLFHKTYQKLIARILVFPLVTVAVINGHAIAGGMVLALSCDYRVMNEQRGFMAMNEIHLPSSIPAGMMSILRAKIGDVELLKDIVLLGEKYTGRQMKEYNVVHSSLTGEGLIEEGLRMAAIHAHPIGKAPFVSTIKKVLYKTALKELTEPEDFDHFGFAQHFNSSKL